MSTELKDLRLKIDPDTHAVLSAIADAYGKDFGEFAREVLKERADRFIHAARLADRRMRVEGGAGILGEGKEKSPR